MGLGVWANDLNPEGVKDDWRGQAECCLEGEDADSPGAHSVLTGPEDLSRSTKICSYHGSAVMNPTSIHEDSGSILGIAKWIKDLVLP